jgi:hypothetical protein
MLLLTHDSRAKVDVQTRKIARALRARAMPWKRYRWRGECGRQHTVAKHRQQQTEWPHRV